MICLIPNAVLAEANACHNPSGAKGGQFCGAKGGAPTSLSSEAFLRRFPPEAHVYRGVSSPKWAAASRRGSLGDGDYGRGLYFSQAIGHAQSYGQRVMGDTTGVFLRAAILPSARVRKLPDSVAGPERINAWATKHRVDVVQSHNYMIVRNPAVLVYDRRNYSVHESVVIDYLRHGWTLPPEYAHVSIPDTTFARAKK